MTTTKASARIKSTDTSAIPSLFQGMLPLYSPLAQMDARNTHRMLSDYEALKSRLASEQQAESAGKEMQVLASARVLELVRELVAERSVDRRYAERLADACSSLEAQVERPSMIPQTKDMILQIALARIGLEQSVIGRSEQGDGFATYKVYTQEKKEPYQITINDDVMSAKDPVKEVAKIAHLAIFGKIGEIAGSDLSPVRPAPLEACATMGITPEDLASRIVNYDSREEYGGIALNFFTYHGDGIQSTMNFSPSLTGSDLLEAIDSAILSMHNASNKPYVVSVLTKYAEDKEFHPCVLDVPEDIRGQAAIIDLVGRKFIGYGRLTFEEREGYHDIGASMPEIMLELLPEKIRRACESMAGVKAPKQVELTSEEYASLIEGIESLIDAYYSADGDEAGLCKQALENFQEAVDLLASGKEGIPQGLGSLRDGKSKDSMLAAAKFICDEITDMQENGLLRVVSE